MPGPAPAAPSAPESDPWAFPSTPAPASGGLITGVPGVGGGAPSAPSAPSAPAPAPATPAPAAVPPTAAPAAPTAEPDEAEWDSTRLTARDVRAMDPAPDVAVVIELESGERRPVDRPTLLGRNPQAPDDGPWNLVAVDDPTRSVSKTHAELRVDPSGLWLTDRGSTNGTVVSVPGAPPRVAEPGARVRVPVGATIHVGDRRIVVHPGAS
ncbi:FOG: FHA domain [Cellulosimicrobium cellulans J34]|nr:FOG: FHA domain [Cellulosimicrobium cellulans J34]